MNGSMKCAKGLYDLSLKEPECVKHLMTIICHNSQLITIIFYFEPLGYCIMSQFLVAFEGSCIVVTYPLAIFSKECNHEMEIVASDKVGCGHSTFVSYIYFLRCFYK